jgi:hypothetical protein
MVKGPAELEIPNSVISIISSFKKTLNFQTKHLLFKKKMDDPAKDIVLLVDHLMKVFQGNYHDVHSSYINLLTLVGQFQQHLSITDETTTRNHVDLVLCLKGCASRMAELSSSSLHRKSLRQLQTLRFRSASLLNVSLRTTSSTNPLIAPQLSDAKSIISYASKFLNGDEDFDAIMEQRSILGVESRDLASYNRIPNSSSNVVTERRSERNPNETAMVEQDRPSDGNLDVSPRFMEDQIRYSGASPGLVQADDDDVEDAEPKAANINGGAVDPARRKRRRESNVPGNAKSASNTPAGR